VSLFGKKRPAVEPEPSDDQKSIMATGIAKMLTIQMALAPTGPCEVSKIEVKKGCVNKKAIGYIYGFVDGALQCNGADIADVTVGPPILYQVLRSLFPGHEQDYMEFLMNHEDDKLVMLGKMTGGQQFFDFNKQDAKGAPMGFARFVIEDQDK
jgi:hypothetical protein